MGRGHSPPRVGRFAVTSLAHIAQDQVAKHTGCKITLAAATAAVSDILGDRRPHDPEAYVRAVIQRDPHRYLPPAGPGGRAATPPIPSADPDDPRAYIAELRQANETEPDEASGDDLNDEPDPEPAAERGKKTSQAAELVTLAGFHFRMVRSEDRRVCAVPLTGPAIVTPLRGPEGLRVRLANIYRQAHPETVASSAALTDALAVLEGQGADHDPEPVHLRAARHRGGVVLDLGTQDGRCVIITPEGWRVAEEPPVLFRRSQLTSPIPRPVRAPDGLARLRALLNVDEAEFRQLVGWLVCALVPDLAHPVLALRGEQGTAKSSAAWMLTMLIDPSPAPLRCSKTLEMEIAGVGLGRDGSGVRGPVGPSAPRRLARRRYI